MSLKDTRLTRKTSDSLRSMKSLSSLREVQPSLQLVTGIKPQSMQLRMVELLPYTRYTEATNNITLIIPGLQSQSGRTNINLMYTIEIILQVYFNNIDQLLIIIIATFFDE
jgi:hypothetical protein